MARGRGCGTQHGGGRGRCGGGERGPYIMIGPMLLQTVAGRMKQDDAKRLERVLQRRRKSLVVS